MMTKGRYDTDDAYTEVTQMIDDKSASKDVPIDSNFNEATYYQGMSARRQGNLLGWNNGRTIHLASNITEEEIIFLQDMPYDLAVTVL